MLVGTVHPTRLAGERGDAGLGVVAAHKGVVAGGADEAAFFAVVSATVDVIVDAVGQGGGLSHGCQVEVAIEIDPLAAVGGPGRAAEGLANAAGQDGLFQRVEMFAGHGSMLSVGDRSILSPMVGGGQWDGMTRC